MNKEAREEIYAGALDTWGLASQLTMLAEEASELSVAALHYYRNTKNRSEIIEEIVDTHIMIEQICYALNLEKEIAIEMEYKLNRLHKRILKARRG